MQPPNATWQQIIAQATQSPDILKQPEVMAMLAMHTKYEKSSQSLVGIWSCSQRPAQKYICISRLFEDSASATCLKLSITCLLRQFAGQVDQVECAASRWCAMCRTFCRPTAAWRHRSGRPSSARCRSSTWTCSLSTSESSHHVCPLEFLSQTSVIFVDMLSDHMCACLYSAVRVCSSTAHPEKAEYRFSATLLCMISTQVRFLRTVQDVQRADLSDHC